MKTITEKVSRENIIRFVDDSQVTESPWWSGVDVNGATHTFTTKRK